MDAVDSPFLTAEERALHASSADYFAANDALNGHAPGETFAETFRMATEAKAREWALAIARPPSETTGSPDSSGKDCNDFDV